MKVFVTVLSIIIIFSFANENYAKSKKKLIKHKVTFIELGSVRCIPCQKMQPVMKSIEKKFGKQVKVIFYDVWTEKSKQKAREYAIKLIPTQIFLDKKGKEFYRHEGFYSESEIEKLLKKRGLEPLKNVK